MAKGPGVRQRLVALALPWSALGWVVGLLLALGGPGVAQAADWVVGGACGSTIQACISNPAVAAGDTISVPVGIYVESLNLTKSVSLKGQPGGAATTIIRAVAGQRVLTVTSAVTQPITLADLTFTGGSTSGSGGGVYILTPAPVLVQSAIFTNNVAGHPVSAGAGLYALYTVTLSDTLFISNTSVGNGGGAWATNATVLNSRFELNRCTGFCSGAGLLADVALTFTNNLVISNSSAYNGGGVGAGASGHAIVTGGLFQNNTSGNPGRGGGGLVTFGTAAISGTQFISNSAFTYGGGLFAWLTTTLTNTVFLSNSATYTDALGGAAYINMAATVTGGEIGGNTSALHGGGLYLRRVSIVTGTVFHDNTAADSGGGLFANQTATLTGAVFHDNSAAELGGGLFAGQGIAITGAEFYGNTSVSNGASAWAQSATVINAWFHDNHCTGFCSAGGIWSNSILTLTDTTFTGNSSAYNGGGAAAVAHAEVSGGLFENNASHTAGYGGGGLIAFNTATLSGTQFLGNSAEGSGGGLYVWYTATLTNTLFLSNTGTLSTSVGGGAALLRAASVHGGQFVGNQSGGVGGLFLRGTASVENTEFNGNLATHFAGGGLRADGAITLTNLSVVGNQSPACGGGLATFSTTAPVLISGGVFSNNLSTTSAGGGLCAYGPATLLNTQVLSNYAVYGGGAYFFTSGNFVGGRVQDNTSSGFGGGIYSVYSIILSGTEVVANLGERGGGVYIFFGGGRVINTLLAGNTSTLGQGHALAAETGLPLLILHSTLAAPAFTSGSAVYLTGTTPSAITNTLIANYAAGIEVAGGPVSEDYNLFSGVTTPTLGATGGAHDVFGAADFLNSLAGDFHLGPASAALDHGAPGTGVSVDFDGAARPYGPLPDIGYDEYTGGYKLFLPLVTRAGPPVN